MTNSQNYEQWFWRAEAYGHKPDEKADAKRMPRFTLEEYFRLTFPQELVKEWEQIKSKYESEFSKYYYKNEKERNQVVGEFVNLELVKFMEANKENWAGTLVFES